MATLPNRPEGCCGAKMRCRFNSEVIRRSLCLICLLSSSAYSAASAKLRRGNNINSRFLSHRLGLLHSLAGWAATEQPVTARRFCVFRCGFFAPLRMTRYCVKKEYRLPYRHRQSIRLPAVCNLPPVPIASVCYRVA